MLKKLTMLLIAFCAIMLLVGCQSTTDKLAESAVNKNVTASGYISMGEVEIANPETGTPQGRIITGKLDYRSRKVGIPADQKVPTTGFFKATKSIGLFGTEDVVIEYDFTAGSDADAKVALENLEKKKQEAETAFENAKTTPEQTK